MDISLLTTILLVLGIVISILSLAAYFVPFGRWLRESRFSFEGAGIKFDSSALTLMFLAGVILTLPGFYLYIRDYEKKLAEAMNENEKLTKELNEKRPYEITATLQFTPDEKPAYSQVRFLECFYLTGKRRGDTEMLKAGDVQPGPSEGSLKVRIRDLQSDDPIWMVQVVNKTDNAKWVYEKPYNPFEPNFQMKKQKQ